MAGRYQSTWQRERDNMESEAIWVGRDYMEGRTNIRQVESYLNHTGHYQGHFSRSEVAKLIAKGAKISEQENKAIKNRVQPEQEPMKFKPKRNAEQAAIKAGGKLANRPEHTRYKPVAKTRKARPGALNEYEVKAQRKQDLKILLDKHIRGQKGVKEVKKESKGEAQGKAYQNVVKNETRHKYVGLNRLWTHITGGKKAPERSVRKKKTEDRYLFTYTQGGARNQQVSYSAPTKEQAKKKFANAHPTATHVDIRLVVRGE